MHTLFSNGMFYTGNRTWSPGVLVDEEGRIVTVCLDDAEVTAFASSGIRQIDMSGRWVLPGFEDAHTHPAGRARTLLELDFRKETVRWEDVKARIQEKAKETPAGQWVVCHGWHESAWGKVIKEDLDAIAPDHGVFLINISYHGGLVSSKGLESLEQKGVHLDTADGLVTEKAFEQVFIATAPDRDAYMWAIPRYQERLVSLGITAVHDMNVATIEQLEAYLEMDRTEQLRFFTAVYLNPRMLAYRDELLPHIGKEEGMLKIAGVKLFLDGAIGTHTAAVHHHYTDGAGEGTLRMTLAECESVVEQAVALRLRHVAMHCIGDRAVDLAVQVFEKLREKYRKEISRWRFEHFEMPDANAIRTVAEHGAIACMQPNFSWDVANYHDRLGEDVQKLNPLRAIIDAGAHMAFGSDDMPADPIKGIAWATAKAPSPEQHISIDEAVAAYTQGGAYAVEMDDRRGKIAPGYEANFVVLEKDIFTVSPSGIENIAVLETWIRGKKV